MLRRRLVMPSSKVFLNTPEISGSLSTCSNEARVRATCERWHFVVLAHSRCLVIQFVYHFFGGRSSFDLVVLWANVVVVYFGNGLSRTWIGIQVIDIILNWLLLFNCSLRTQHIFILFKLLLLLRCPVATLLLVTYECFANIVIPRPASTCRIRTTSSKAASHHLVRWVCSLKLSRCVWKLVRPVVEIVVVQVLV